jgi:[protein-PII] uridylyltransferase
LINPQTTRGGTELFVYTKDQPVLFASVVAELDRRNYSVHDAHVMVSKDGYILDTFIILDHHNQPLEPQYYDSVIKHLKRVITDGHLTQIKVRRIPRNLMHFKVQTRTEFMTTKNNKRTLMELIALDTPGLIASVGATFAELDIHLHSAKITTIGERAEDLFIITSPEGQPLDEELQERLREKLKHNLSKLAP